jgi:RNA polymerase sigma-70 factor (ECF subfamily)
MHNQTDEELVRAYYNGDQAAFRELFDRYKTRVLNFCLRILGNRSDAEDVTSEVFMALAERRYILRVEAKCATWIYTVARNACITRIRRRKYTTSLWFTHDKSGEVAQIDPVDTQHLPPDKIIQEEHITLMRASIAELPLEQREALVLREYQKLSYQEIAVVLNCSLEKVKVLIFRGRENLRGIVMRKDPEFLNQKRNIQ